MKKQFPASVFALFALSLCPLLTAHPVSGNSIGGGAHYYRTIDNVKIDDIEENGVTWFFSYQTRSENRALQFDLEILPDDFAGSTETVLAPQAYLLFGGALYGGVGAGIFYSDSDFADRPFYVFRAGLNIMLNAKTALDINANYRFTEWDSDLMQDIDTDTATLSAALRFIL